MKITRKNILYGFLLLLVLLLATWIRFYRLDWVEFKLDEANVARRALGIARYGQTPVWGIGASVGIPNGALSEWLLAIPYRFSRSPLGGAAFIVALNVLAVGLTCAFAARLGGPAVGVIAGLLFAVAPWAVVYSRKLWAHPSLLPPFVVAYVWTGQLAFVEKRTKWFLAHVLLLGACIELNYSALTLAVVSALSVVIFWWRKWPWRVLLATVLLGALLAGALLYLDARSPAPLFAAGSPQFLPNLLGLLKIARGFRPQVDGSALRLAWLVVTGTDLHSLASASEYRAYLDTTLPIKPVLSALGAMAVLALAWAIWRAAREWESAQARSGLLLAMAVLAPVGMFVRHSTPVYPHYFILLYPWPFVLVAMMGVWAAKRSKRRLITWSGMGLLIMIAAAQVYAYLTITYFVASRFTPGGYGTPLSHTLQAVRQAEHAARSIGGSILLVAEGDKFEFDEPATLWDTLVDPRIGFRPVDQRQAMVYPATPTVIVYAPGAIECLRGAGVSYIPLTPPITTVPLRPGEGEYRLVTWAGENRSLIASSPLAGPRRWACGVQLLATECVGMSQSGGALHWKLTWRVDSARVGHADYHWFNHLLAADGRRVGQKDGVGFPSRTWQAGDIVMTWFDVPIAADATPGLYTMRVGLYSYPAIQNVRVLDEQGNEVSDAIEIGPIEILRVTAP